MNKPTKVIRDMSQIELMDLMERYEKAKTKSMDVYDEAKGKDLTLKDKILDLSNERREIEIKLLETEDKTTRKWLKADIIKKQTEINKIRKDRIPYERTMETAHSQIKKFQAVYERAKSRYYNNKQ